MYKILGLGKEQLFMISSNTRIEVARARKTTKLPCGRFKANARE